MLKLIISDYWRIRLILDDFRNQVLKGLVFLKDEEYRLSISVLDVTKCCSILFLVRKSQFMLLYKIVLIVVNVTQSKDSILLMSAHSLAVNIDAFFIVFDEVSFLDKFVEVFSSFGIYEGFILNIIWKVHFRLIHVIKAHWLAFSQYSCLLSIQNIIRMGENLKSNIFIT